MKKRSVYTVDGQRVPGVTSIIGAIDKSAALVPWAARMATDSVRDVWKAGVSYSEDQIESTLEIAKRAHSVRKTDAGAAGTNVHELIGAFIEGQLKPENMSNPKERLIVENFQLVTQGWKWLASEVVVLHKTELYGGTADSLAVLPNEMRVIPDWKTSKNVYASFSLQIAMYAAAEPMDERLREEWKKVKEGRILHYNADRHTWEVLEIELESQYPYIPAVRKMYQWKKEFDSQWH